MSIIGEDGDKTVRMAHLASVGCNHVNGVSGLHTELLKRDVLRDFHDFWPDKFVNVTNGVTPRRWVRLSNPAMAADAHGRRSARSGSASLASLKKLEPLADDAAFRERWRETKRANKQRLAAIVAGKTGIHVDPGSMFDIQVKRIHEYKRQHLNVAARDRALQPLAAQPRRSTCRRGR